MYNVCFCFRISIEGELPFYRGRLRNAPTIYQKATDNQGSQLPLLLFQFFDYYLVVDFTFYKNGKN